MCAAVVRPWKHATRLLLHDTSIERTGLPPVGAMRRMIASEYLQRVYSHKAGLNPVSDKSRSKEDRLRTRKHIMFIAKRNRSNNVSTTVFSFNDTLANDTVPEASTLNTSKTEQPVENQRNAIQCSDTGSQHTASSFVKDEHKYVRVWCDGACLQNGREGASAGIGVWFNHNHRCNVSAAAVPPATNNSAEIQAARRAVATARAQGFRRVRVHTDSRFVIDCAERWLQVWRRNGWRLAGGGMVKNKPQLLQLAKTMDGISVKWEFVRGHSGDVGNDEADRLAREAASAAQARLRPDPAPSDGG